MSRTDYNRPDTLAEEFLGYYIWHPQADGPPEQFRDPGQAEYRLKRWRGGFYEWFKGRYLPVCDEDISALVTGYLKGLNNRPYQPADPPIKITRSMVENVLLNVMAEVYMPDWRELNTWKPGADCKSPDRAGVITIPFLNGLLMFGGNLDEPVFVPHTPRYFSLVRLPYNYEPHAQCPRWQAFLDDVMQGDAERIVLLQEWAGYLLTNSLKFHKFLLIAGEGGNGKTVFTTILEKTVGEDNVSHVPLSSFGDRFALAHTVGRMLNSTSESSHKLGELCETMLKSYTSGDRMTFERKYRQSMDAYPTAKVMISTNQLPNFTDRSNGIWRRLLFVPFDKTIPVDEQNPDLVDELTAELPGIFNWAMEGLQKLTADGRFIEPERCKEAMNEYRKDTNPARVFLEENYIEGFEFEGVACGELYQTYVTWCEQNGYHPLNSSNLGKEIKRTFPDSVKVQKRQGGRRIWVFSGLSLSQVAQASSYCCSS